MICLQARRCPISWIQICVGTSRAFFLLGYARLEGQPFKLEVVKIVPLLLGEGVDVLCRLPLVFETTFW